MFTTEQKKKLVSNVRLRLAREFPDINPAQACLQSSFLVLHELYKLNIRGVLQCGNMHWRAVAKEKDDGVSPTHYAMLWSPFERRSLEALLSGRMPEIHCWVGLVESQEIIDITVKFFPMAWKTAMGYDWLTKQPPDYLWHSVRDLEELDCMYEPIEAATHYGMQMLDVIVSQRKNKR